jgi:chemotaxis protein MotB
MKRTVKVEPVGDIPAWFMTYSDVITLLMTFFILLLTFSTTEPERYERVARNIFGQSGATGLVGYEQKGADPDSWAQRVRPRAARIALHGAEMPPVTQQPAESASGRGLEAANEDQAQKDVMLQYSILLPAAELMNSNLNLTSKGAQIATKLAAQLRSLSIHCAIEISTKTLSPNAVALLDHLYQVEGTRPGQISIGFADDVPSDTFRLTMERYE